MGAPQSQIWCFRKALTELYKLQKFGVSSTIKEFKQHAKMHFDYIDVLDQELIHIAISTVE